MLFDLRRPVEGRDRPSRLRRLTDIVAAVVAPSGLVSALIACSLTLTAAVGASAAKPSSKEAAKVRVSTAKLRSAPDEDSRTTTLLDKGDSARVTGRKNGWLRLRLDSGREGWVRSDLVSVSAAEARDEDENSEADTATARRRKAALAAKKALLDAQRREAAQKLAQIAKAKAAKKAAAAKLARAAAAKAAKTKAAKIAAAAKRRAPVTITAAAPFTPSAVPAAPTPAPLTPAAFEKAVADAERVVREAEETRRDIEPAVREAVSLEPEPDNDEPVLVRAAERRAPAAAASRAESPRVSRMVSRALAYRGTPYRMGATGNGAFDCSGFTQYLFGTVGERLPRTAAEQYSRGTPVAKSDLLPGDLVFFKNTYKRGVSHVGIYIGNGSFVHASSGRGRGVTVTSLHSAYYQNHWAGARRPR